jgi:DNA-binding PadR family transcriptional regulator
MLGLLAQRPRHGYELRAAFEAVVGGRQIWELKPAQVYSTLGRLEREELVEEQALEQDSGPEKRIYAITPPGRAILQEWFTTPVETRHQRDEFFLKLMLSLVTRAVSPYDVIYVQRDSLYQELHDLSARRADADPGTELAHILLMEQAIMHLEADLRWLEMVEARLDEVKKQPLPEPQPRRRGRPRKHRHSRGSESDQ